MKRKGILFLLSSALLLTACTQTNLPPSDSKTASVELTSEAPATESTEHELPAEATESTEIPETESAEHTANDALGVLWDRIANAGAAAGICYLGFFNEETAAKPSDVFASDEIVMEYPCLAKIPEALTVNAGGYEIYGLVPAKDVKKVTVNAYDPLSDSEAMGDVLLESSSSDPILLICNPSDLAGNTWITIEASDGTLVEFSPGLSLRDGSLLLPKTGVLNIGMADHLMLLQEEEALVVNGSELLLSIPQKDDLEMGAPVLSYKGQELVPMEFVEWLHTSYVLTTDSDVFYVFVEGGFSNDWSTLALIQYSDAEGLQLLENIDGYLTDLFCVSEDSFTIGSRRDIFGTRAVFMPYAMEDGQPVMLSTSYSFRNYPDPTMAFYMEQVEDKEDSMFQIYREDGTRILTVIKEFSATDSSDQTVLIPVDACIAPQGYDPLEQIFYFEYEDKICTVNYEFDEENYSYLIDGVDQYELFAVLPYAG